MATAIIEQIEPAFKPTKPVLPNPDYFSAGSHRSATRHPVRLILDHLEDKIVFRILNIVCASNAGRVASRNAKTRAVARLVIDDQFSQFAEAVAGLLPAGLRAIGNVKVLLCGHPAGRGQNRYLVQSRGFLRSKRTTYAVGRL